MPAVARTNPLPVGLYDVDLSTPAHAARLAAWEKANAGKVLVRGATGRTVRFEVRGRPGAFPFGALGYPTVATSSTGQSDQTSSSDLEGLALVWILWKLTRRRRR